MIRCNLSVLLAERELKISDVARITGISRTTLTALAYNHGKGIQFDTFDTLCNYLKVTPNELFIQEKFNYEFEVLDYNPSNRSEQSRVNSIIEFKDQKIVSEFLVDISIGSSEKEPVDGKEYITDIGLHAKYSDEIKTILQDVPRAFITELEKELLETVKSNLILHYSFDDDLKAFFY
ncbi:helix-turn-helix transcriptional regulator [Sporosarcina sp. FSL K6-2383]|uniref:helix-turn-helix domain-containing protein n=1 Tax=Sporosarcina sp. FSL K6-2383 TaxID=2921556 RepID=UPI00315AFEB1